MKKQTESQKDDRFQQTNNIILNNDKFLVAVAADSYDSIAAGTGLASLLESLGKDVDLYSLQTINPNDYPELTGLDKFKNQLKSGDKKLEIIFKCPIDDIERVGQVDEGDNLKLTVNFRPDSQAVSPADVEIKRPEPAYPAGFIIGVDLPNEQGLTGQGQWIWVSNKNNQKNWASVSVVENKATLSESLIALVSRGDFQVPAKSANNFYLGIKKGTKGFENADSIALETAAYCLRIKEKQSGQKPVTKPVIEESEIEAKESASPEGTEGKTVSEWQKPPIFTGATTPKK